MYGGTQLAAIGVLHNVIGFALGAEPLRRMFAAGWIGAAEASFDQAAIFWFLWFGWMLMLLGGALRALEAQGRVPTALLAATAAMCLGGAISIPASGFWLGLIPVATILARQRRVALA